MSDPRCPKCDTPSIERLRPADRPNDWGDDVHLCRSCGTEFYANYECDGDWEGWVTKSVESIGAIE